MIKLNIDQSSLDGLDDIVDGLKERVKAATSAIVTDASSHARSLAQQKLGPSGLKNWNGGFKVHKLNEDEFIISIDGQLANWMEDGIKVGEISKSIMQGSVAKQNAAQGKDYVDVPISKNADQAGNISTGKGGSINVAAFKNADSMLKSINVSYGKQGTKQKQVMQSRVKDIIKNTEAAPGGSGNTSYLTIRRVTKDSVWPSSPFPGAKVLESLDSYIDQNLEAIISRFI